MSIMAMRLTPEYFAAVSALIGADPEMIEGEFTGTPYMIVIPVTPTEFTLKLMTEDQMFEAYANDPELEIVN